MTSRLRLIIGIGLILGFSALMWGAWWWAGTCRLFQLERILVQGSNLLPEEDYQRLLGDLEGVGIHELDLTDIRILLEAHPLVKAVRVSRRYPRTIRVEVVERSPLAILNLDPHLLIDAEGVILPDAGLSDDLLVPVLSGFNPARELYPPGQKTLSIKVHQAVALLNQIQVQYPSLYYNLSEITLNVHDEFVLILAERPTRVILGRDRMGSKLAILKAFQQTLAGRLKLTDYALLDIRYAKQMVAREWS